MYLLVKGKKPQPICRECRAAHPPQDCPRQPAVNRQAVRQAADDFYERTTAYWKDREQQIG